MCYLIKERKLFLFYRLNPCFYSVNLSLITDLYQLYICNLVSCPALNVCCTKSYDLTPSLNDMIKDIFETFITCPWASLYSRRVCMNHSNLHYLYYYKQFDYIKCNSLLSTINLLLIKWGDIIILCGYGKIQFPPCVVN